MRKCGVERGMKWISSVLPRGRNCVRIWQLPFGKKKIFFTFYNVDHFSSLYWMCYNIDSLYFTLVFFLFLFLFWPWDMGDLIFLTRDQTRAPCIGRQGLNHWTTREVSQGVPALKKTCIPCAQGSVKWQRCSPCKVPGHTIPKPQLCLQ